MRYIAEHFTTTLEVKKSKFIAHIVPYEQFDSMMESLKKDHPKARHFVYAYRYLNRYNQVVENCSDDGEPKGTSGKPTLLVLAGKDIINTAVIVVRYFGGIKLGTGGLVKAYSDAVNLVLQNSTLLQYVELISYSLQLQYNQLSQIEYILKRLDIQITNKEFLSNITLHLVGSKESFEKLQTELSHDNILIKVEQDETV